jgi:RNA recognition motif-containing protein
MAQAWRRLLLARAPQLPSPCSIRSSGNGSGSGSGSGTVRRPPALLSAFRFFNTGDGGKLFVGGISFNTTEDGLRDAFAAHGEVMDAKIIMDRETGRSRGFGFVTYYKEEDADTALSKLNGHNLDGRVIRVDRAASRPARPMGGGFGGGDGGFSGSSFGGDSSAEPAATEEDWGSLPSLDVDLNASQN